MWEDTIIKQTLQKLLCYFIKNIWQILTLLHSWGTLTEFETVVKTRTITQSSIIEVITTLKDMQSV